MCGILSHSKQESSQSPRRSFFSRASHRYPTNTLFSARYLQIRIILKRMTYPTWHPFFYFYFLFLLLLFFFNFTFYKYFLFLSLVAALYYCTLQLVFQYISLIIRSENISSKIFNVSDLFLKCFQCFLSLFFILHFALVRLTHTPFILRLPWRTYFLAALLRRAVRVRAPLADRSSATATAPCAPVPWEALNGFVRHET